jgi:uncharacterized membrane protein
MPSWLVRLRDVVWTAVLSVILLVAGLVVAIFVPDYPALAIVLGIGSVSLSLLSTRV